MFVSLQDIFYRIHRCGKHGCLHTSVIRKSVYNTVKLKISYSFGFIALVTVAVRTLCTLHGDALSEPPLSDFVLVVSS
jgi:hypothetical protein